MKSENKEEEGRVYGNLLVRLNLGTEKDSKGKRRRQVLAECLNCGSGVKKYRLDSLRGGKTTSCGCIRNERVVELNKKHGMHNTRPYSIWEHIIARCNNKNCKSYKDYGGRGIVVCKKWHTFEGFWEDMQKGYKDNLSIDRINVNGNYCKENCRWANGSEQSYNTRKQKNNTSGKTGVSVYKKSKQWRASICVNNKQHHLGLFDTFDEALQARQKAEIKFFGYNKE